MARSKKLHPKVVTIESAAASLPAPSLATDGEDITDMVQAGSAERAIALKMIAASGSATLSNAKLCVYDGEDEEWAVAVLLNNGDDIDLTTTLGWEEVFLDIGINTRLDVYATVTGGGTVRITAKPVEVR